MKRLIWKELFEVRWAPVFLAPLIGIVVYVWCLQPFGGISWTGPICFFTVGIIVGAGMIAGERNRGTLAFLSSLPLDRSSIWLAKFAAGLIASVACSAVIYPLLLLIFSHVRGGPATQMVWNMSFLLIDMRFAQWWSDMAVLLVFGLSVAMVISTLVDNVVSALIFALSLACLILCGALDVYYFVPAGREISNFIYTSLAVAAAVFLVSSFVLFRSETGSARRRTRIIFYVVVGLTTASIVTASNAEISRLGYQSITSSPGTYYVTSSFPRAGGSSSAIGVVYDFDGVLIGHTYPGFVPRCQNTNFPWRIVASSNCIRSEVITTHQLIDMDVSLQFTYTPAGAPGLDKQTIRVFDSKGTEIMDILVNAVKLDPGYGGG